MTKVPTGKPVQNMTTLDKLWSSIAEEEEEDMMIEGEEKSQPKSTTNEKNVKTTTTTTKTKVPTTKKPYETVQHTTPLFPTTIRFNIKAPTVNEASAQHITVLKMISTKMGHCEIYSKDTEKVQPEQLSADDFEYHERGKKTKIFIVVHRLVLDQKYHQIKKTREIFDCMKENNCFLQEHSWTTKEWDITNIGFLSGVSPKHQSKDSVTHKLELIEKTSLHFELHATLVNITRNGTKHSTYAYEVQCQRQHAEEVCKYIALTSREYGQTFVKYKWKYTNPEVFVNALNKQNDFINNIRTIPIYGISNIAMKSMYHELMRKKEILEVGATSKTFELGRWNIYTKLANFQSTTKWLQINLSKTYDKLPSDITDETPTNFIVEVRFNTTITFDGDDDPLLQYAVNSVNAFSDTSSTNTWISEESDKRTWASVASGSQGTSSITATSELSKNIQKLSDSLSTICARLNKIEETLLKHSNAIENAQKFEKECNENMNKLVVFIKRLETRTSKIQPRNLEDYYDYQSSESNKRQNINQSPQKAPPS